MKVAEAFKSMASQAADAIVNASALKQEMAELRSGFDELKRDMEYTRQRNVELDNTLRDVRRQRDEAEQKLSQTQAQLSAVSADRSEIENNYNSQSQTIVQLRAELASVKHERDDYGMEAMKLREDLEKAQGKLAEIEHFAASLFPKPVEVPKPTPEPEHTVPTKPESTKRRYEDEPGFEWNGSQYDRTVGKWYNEV